MLEATNLKITALLRQINLPVKITDLFQDSAFQELLESLRSVNAFSHDLDTYWGGSPSIRTLSLLRQLKIAYAMPASQFFSLLHQLACEVSPETASSWQDLSHLILKHEDKDQNIAKLLLKYGDKEKIRQHLHVLEEEDPHAIYPTSAYRSSSGVVNSSEDGMHIDAVMTTSTMTEIHITEGILEPDNAILKNIYRSHGRCICVIDSNVHQHYGDDLKSYFEVHSIDLQMLVYRAMEVDKGIHSVEALLADFKKLGVSRQEPVLIVGGGVIADIGGLACALYHRSTPYIMLATSIVSGIDAGPSPRTCCDGFGFKNLFGAYHAPVLTLTDSTFFKTLRIGWIRHGIAEIIKMAVVKDKELFHLLEDTGIELLTSKFGTTTSDVELKAKCQSVLALSMRSYVQSEYSNLYETHQCRPHAYGHTWSPGFEIPSGMLHGHAIACGMGFGAQLSYLQGWISQKDRDRILQLISQFELSLWHPILDDIDLLQKAQEKITEKRGGNLVAPIPKGTIGQCGYLNELTYTDLKAAIEEYKVVCQAYPRAGEGVEPHCLDVGLEDPSTVGHITSGIHSIQSL